MLELSDKDYKAAIMKIHQQVLKHSHEANLKNGKSQQRNRSYFLKKKRTKREL